MIHRRLLNELFPRPRRPVRPIAALPLVVFLAVFLGVSLFLTLRGIVSFSTPRAFLLAIAAPWIWWMSVAGSSGLRGLRALAALAVRFAVLATLILALAEPRAVRKSSVLALLYTLDVSDSMGEAASQAALEFTVRTASEKPEKDEAGLVVFGREAVVELPPRTTFPFEAINSRVGKDGTNLEKGLSLAAAMLPEGRPGRIVLVTDGVSTEGSLSTALDDLAARSIPVDVLPVEYDHGHEVWLEKLDLPRQVKTGETYEATVILSSLQPGSGILTLKENGQEIAKEQVAFDAGKNRYVLPLRLRSPGFYEYVAAIDVPPDKDGWRENNIAVNHIFLKGKGNILIVTDPSGNEDDWSSLEAALMRGQRQVQVVDSYGFPRDAFSLMPYDCVVFVNVAADAFDAVQLKAVHDAVYNQGTGFLMVGGKNSFGPGGYHRTPVEQALPVTMDITQKKILPKGALVIVLHTCEFDEGNTWGKRIAKEALRVLGAQDECGILAYGMGGEQWLFGLTPAGDYDRLVPVINQAVIGDMPSFDLTMRMGLDALIKSDASQKHVIIISDGDPSPPMPALIKDYQRNQISVSTVAIWPHDGANGSCVALLRQIAVSTGGRFYYPNDPRSLPAIFIKEAKTLKRSMIQNKDFVPAVNFPSAILRGIDALPPLHGLVLTTPKPLSMTILRVPDTEDLDPILTTWRYGIGKTAAFTSDLATNWGADWVRSKHYAPFVQQLITDIVRAAEDSHLRLQSYAEGSTGTLIVEDFHPRASFLEIAAEVSGPHGKSLTVPLKQVAPRRYAGEFPIWGNGPYHVVAAGVGVSENRNERALGRFVVAYSPEYLRFRSNPIVLRQIAQRTGGRLLRGDEKGEDLFVRDRPPKSTSQPIADWFLVALALLIPLDVGIRRIQLDWFVIRSWFLRRYKGGPSGETFQALLRRKKSIEFPAAEKREGRPLEPTPAAAPPKPAPPPTLPPAPRPAPKPTPPADEKGPEPTTTAGRLLAKKKQWKKE